MRKDRMALLAGAAIAALSPIAGAQIISGTTIYQDTFANTTGAPILLNGYSPNVTDLYGSSWVSASATASPAAPDALFMIPTGGGMTSVVDGAANPNTTEDTATIVDAYLPVNITAGTIYDLNVSMQVPTSNTGGHGAEMAFMPSSGFNSHNGPTIASNGSFGSTVYPDTGDGSGALSNLNCYGLILQKDNGNTQMFSGQGTGGNVVTLGGLTTTNFINYDILLNTEGANWTITQYMNGTQENTGTLTGAPSMGFVALCMNRASGNFDFSLTALPEPSSMGLVGVGALMLAKRRRAQAKPTA